MSNEIIYLNEPGDGTYSMHRMELHVDHTPRRDDPHRYVIGPWDKDSQWTAKALSNPVDMVLVDHGDGVQVTAKHHEDGISETINLDYAQIIDLMMLIDAYNREQHFQTKFKRFQEAL